MSLQKFGAEAAVEHTGWIEVETGASIELPATQPSPEEKYEGTWSPGSNHPQLPPDESGPYAGIPRYRPVPESQIQR